MKVVQIQCETRSPGGTGKARAARRGGSVPCVVYGEKKDPEHLALPAKQFRAAVDAGARVIDLSRGGSSERVLLKDVQWDALGGAVVHADLLRMDPAHEITLRIPITFDGVPKGAAEGGVLQIMRDTIAVRCLPKDIPEGVTVSVATLGLNEAIDAGKVALPSGCKLGEDAHDTIAVCRVPKVEKAPEPAAADAAAPAEGAAAAPAAAGAAPAAGDAKAPAKAEAKPAADKGKK